MRQPRSRCVACTGVRQIGQCSNGVRVVYNLQVSIRGVECEGNAVCKGAVAVWRSNAGARVVRGRGTVVRRTGQCSNGVRVVYNLQVNIRGVECEGNAVCKGAVAVWRSSAGARAWHRCAVYFREWFAMPGSVKGWGMFIKSLHHLRWSPPFTQGRLTGVQGRTSRICKVI